MTQFLDRPGRQLLPAAEALTRIPARFSLAEEMRVKRSKTPSRDSGEARTIAL